MKTKTILLLSLLVGVGSFHASAGLFGPKGDMLAELYKANPKLKDHVKKATGFETFKQSDMNLVLLASGNGDGLFVDRKTGKEAFMQEASLGGGLRQIKAVCTIEGLDRPTETVSLKGPSGGYASVRTSNPGNLPHRIGDTVLVTYTEALAITLEELAKPPAQTQ